MHEVGQSRGFLHRFLLPLLKTRISLIENLVTPLTKSILLPLGLTAAAAVTVYAVIHIKKMFGYGNTMLKISNEEMNDIMEIVKSLEESGLLIIDIREIIKNAAEEEKGGFQKMLLGTLGASLLGNLWTEKRSIGAGESTIRAGQDFWCSSWFSKIWNTNISPKLT